jgi:hypothetical protein
MRLDAQRRIGAGGRHEGRGRQGEQQARPDQRQVIRGERRHEIGEREQRQGRDQEALALDRAGDDRHDRRAHRVGEREEGDEMAGHRDRLAEVLGDIGKQAGDHESLRADHESAERQPNEFRHEEVPKFKIF